MNELIIDCFAGGGGASVGIEMGYRDITSQSAVKPVLWGTRAVERDKKRQQELEQLHNVRVGKEVKIQVEDSDISDGRKRKRVEIKKATVAGVYEHFILLHFKVKGNGLQETFFWDDFRKIRR